jgi:predicted RNase H-like HicB family nuclease
MGQGRTREAARENVDDVLREVLSGYADDGQLPLAAADDDREPLEPTNWR